MFTVANFYALICIVIKNFMAKKIVSTAPVGAPLNPSATVIDSHTLLFMWEQPLQELRNGIIRQYHISVTEVDTRQQFQVVSTTTSVSVSSLHPYYTYQWAVSAFTTGRGPFSQSQMIMTPEDGIFFSTRCLYKIYSTR